MAASFDFVSFVDAQQLSKHKSRQLRDVSEVPITFTDLRALKVLGVDHSTVTHAARTLGVDLSRASRHVARLERLGLVERTPDVEDGRTVRVALSDEGKRVVRSWRLAMEADYVRAQAGWDDDELERSNRLVARFHEAIVVEYESEITRSRNSDASFWPLEPGSGDPRATMLTPTLRLVDWIPVSSATMTIRTHPPLSSVLLRILGATAVNRSTAIGEIARRSNTTASNASRQVQQLEAAGLVVRAVHPHDRRSHLIKATTRGLTLLRQVRVEGAARHAAATSTWARPDVVELLRGFDRLLDDLRVRRLPSSGAFDQSSRSGRWSPVRA